MKKLPFLIVFISVLVIGCSSTQVHNSTTKSKNKNSYTRKMTAEEQGYIQLVLNKDYDTLDSQTKNQSNEVQKDYNNIAFALKNYQEAQKIEDNGEYYSGVETDQQMKYYSIEKALQDVKYIPTKIKKQIEEVKNTSIQKDEYYTNIVSDQQDKRNAEQKQADLEDKADQRTADPHQVEIGMTKEEVLTEGWGRPEDVNRTTTANGTSEQWVYSGYRYLYFEDGILVTIQD